MMSLVALQEQAEIAGVMLSGMIHVSLLAHDFRLLGLPRAQPIPDDEASSLQESTSALLLRKSLQKMIVLFPHNSS
jgi:hypothetical protein